MKRSRIIALFLIILFAAGLAYLRYAPGEEPMTVPAGAKTGGLDLQPGTFETEDGPYAADIGTLVVPENRNDPDSRLMALPVVRVRARTDHPAEPLFRLEGGPGVSNMKFEQASRYAGDRDVVLVGYRGADGSSVLDAPEVVEALRHSADVLGEDSLRAYSDGFRAAAERWKAWLVAAPIVHLIDGQRTVPLGYGQHFTLETWTFPLIFLAGIVLFQVTAHVVRAVTRAHASYAKAMLTPRAEATNSDRGRIEATAQLALDGAPAEVSVKVGPRVGEASAAGSPGSFLVRSCGEVTGQ